MHFQSRPVPFQSETEPSLKSPLDSICAAAPVPSPFSGPSVLVIFPDPHLDPRSTSQAMRPTSDAIEGLQVELRVKAPAFATQVHMSAHISMPKMNER